MQEGTIVTHGDAEVTEKADSGPLPARTLNGREFRCGMELALSIVGGKWKPLVLYHLGLAGKLRFGALERTLPGVSRKVLTRQLRELEKDGLVIRTVHAVVPPKVEYELSGLGESAMPMLESLCRWGEEYYRRAVD